MRDPVDTLKAELECARSRAPSSEVENLPRTIMLEALDATHRYLASIGIEDRLRAPLLHLIGAIQDIENGRTSAALSPGPYATAKQRGQQLDIAEFAMAAAAVTIMREQPGVSTEKALSDMARIIGTDTNILRDFRKNIRRKRANKEAIREYWDWLATRHKFEDLPTADFIEIMKDKAKRLHLKKG